MLRPLFLGANDCRLLSLCHHDGTITLHRELGRGSVWGVGRGKDTTGMVICCQGAGSHHVSLLYLISDDVKGRVFSTRGDSPFSGSNSFFLRSLADSAQRRANTSTSTCSRNNMPTWRRPFHQ